MFAHHMKWDDDITLEHSVDTRRGLLQLAMYAMHVGTGQTLLCKTIKVATVKQYVRAAATFLTLFGDKTRDYRKNYATDTALSSTLVSVYNELARWESVPDRREPYTLEMLTYHKQSVERTAACQDSLAAAMADWFECGLFAGLRLAEWAQDAHCAALGTYKRDFKQQARAFCLSDVRFEDDTRTRFSAKQVLEHKVQSSIRKCWIKFRTQKNGQHGEERLFTRNDNGMCFVQAMLRIIARFERLVGIHDVCTPLALYKNKGETIPKFITASEIEATMRHTAAVVYKLDPVKDKKILQKWSAHSLRVGACVILHAMGCTESQIQWLLRWRSNAFMVYLRNVAILSTLHHQIIDEAAAMPHFF
jgi:hypothetical protein